MGGCQELIGFLGLEVLLRWGSLHEMGIEVFVVVVLKKVSAQNLPWISNPVVWGVSPGWEDIIWKIEVMAPGLFFGVLLIDPPECLTLVLHGLLWYFPNRKVTQRGGSGLANIPGNYSCIGSYY